MSASAMDPKEVAVLLGIDWPKAHPSTGEPFEDGNITRDFNPQFIEYMRPSPPSRVVVEYDDNGCVTERRELSDAELEAAQASYEKALTEWQRTGGRAMRGGTTTVRGTFTTASGAMAEGVFADGQWHWHAFNATIKSG